MLKYAAVSSLASILYKYVYKGPDMASVAVESLNESESQEGGVVSEKTSG